MPEISLEDLSRLTDKPLREHAVDFRDYKPSTLGRRVMRRLEATGCADVSAYLGYLDLRPDEYARLIDSILIKVTEFLREPESWEIVKNDVYPSIMAEKRPGDRVRMWSAGCATGEEPYTMAIVLSETLGSRMKAYDVKIYATDMDDGALAFAGRGEYPDDSVKPIPEAQLRRYFTRNERWTVDPDLRKIVTFSGHNLVTDPPILGLDMIVCRNVLIYMTVDLQNRILSKFHDGLKPGGFLFLGKAESPVTSSKLFRSAHERWRIFRKQSHTGAPEGAAGHFGSGPHSNRQGSQDDMASENG